MFGGSAVNVEAPRNPRVLVAAEVDAKDDKIEFFMRDGQAAEHCPSRAYLVKSVCLAEDTASVEDAAESKALVEDTLADGDVLHAKPTQVALTAAELGKYLSRVRSSSIRWPRHTRYVRYIPREARG